MPTTIHTEGDFLKIVSDTITTLLPKASIIIQKENQETFFIKSQDYIRYFKINDITYPLNGADASVNIDDIIDIVKNDIVGSDTEISFKDITNADLIYQAYVKHDDNMYAMDTLQKKSGGEVHDKNGVSYDNTSGHVKLTTSVDIDTIIRQSNEYMEVPFGNAISALITATLSGEVSSIGLFDDTNGVFIKTNLTNSTINLVVRTSPGNEMEISSADWNVDKADGTGKSSINLANIFATEMNTWVIIIGNIQGSVIKIGMYKNDHLHIFHEISDDVLYSFGYNFSNSVPVRLQVEDIVGRNTIMTHSNIAVYAVNRQTILSKNITVMNEEGTILHPSNTTEGFYKMICSLKLHGGYNRSKLVVRNIHIMSTTSDSLVEYTLVLNHKLQDYVYVSNAIKAYAQSLTSPTLLDVLSITFSDVFGILTNPMTPKMDIYKNVLDRIMVHMNDPETLISRDSYLEKTRNHLMIALSAFDSSNMNFGIINDDVLYPTVSSKINAMSTSDQGILTDDSFVTTDSSTGTFKFKGAFILYLLPEISVGIPVVNYPTEFMIDNSKALYSQNITQLDTGMKASTFFHFGHVIASGYLKGDDEKTIILKDNNKVVSSDINGTSYEVSLFCKSLNTTQTNIFAGLTWDEYH
jgi:hypothetical protein